MANPITTENIQHWMRTATSPADVFTNVTEAVKFDPAVDLQTYDPKYKDRLNQPSYVTGKKTTIEFEIDYFDDGDVVDFLVLNEDVINVETEIVRVYMMTAAESPATGYVAKLATFSMNQNPIDGAAGEVLKLTGTLAMTSDGWETGTFDPDTATFTPDAVS